MVDLNIKVDTRNDKADAFLKTDGATLADLAITERILRRYLKKVIITADNLLDKDTDTDKKKNLRFNTPRDLESLRLPVQQSEPQDDN